MTTNNLLKQIEETIAQKKSANKKPYHALFLKDLLSGRNREELKQPLRELPRQGKIQIGNTINDYYITIKN